METLQTTPLTAWHAAHGGKLVDFAGWSMPVQYSSIVEEHTATRTHCGLFDISHMGRLRFSGPSTAQFLDKLLTRSVLDLPAGRIRYSLMTNTNGGILDDVLIYRLADVTGEFHYLVVNAGNRQKIVSWILQHLPASEVSVADETSATAMIAVQGPSALDIAQPLFDFPLSSLAYYGGAAVSSHGRPVIVSRTGYTGEDGVELSVPAESAVEIWEQLCAAGARPAGLGARDTLRLEAAMPLYGHELSEAITPLHAGLSFAVNLQGRDFIGSTALAALDQASLPRRVGIEMESRRVPREHFGVFVGDQRVGEVTSGTFSPTLQRAIAMASVEAAAAVPGTDVFVDIRGSRERGRVVRLPFYTRVRSVKERQ